MTANAHCVDCQGRLHSNGESTPVFTIDMKILQRYEARMPPLGVQHDNESKNNSVFTA